MKVLMPNLIVRGENSNLFSKNFFKLQQEPVYFLFVLNFGNRFNRENPCKAVNTLQSVLLNWTTAYSMNCQNTDAALKWFDRVERHSDKITRKLMKQKSIKNAGNCE